VTLTASYQKVFSDDPKLGFFAQRSLYSDALEDGEVIGAAQDLDQMQQIVTNTTVDGILAAFFALLVIVVIADATRVCIRTLRHPESVVTTEAPYERSKLYAPSGMFATRDEKHAMAASIARGDQHDPEERR
jgi:carbon starvation protein